MAKYTINRSCGHEERIQIYGPERDRDGKAEREARKLCGECYRTAKLAESKIAGEQAVAATADRPLPALSGSEKQIAWAEQIRAQAILHGEASICRWPERLQTVVLPAYRAGLEAKIEAKWWIDHRPAQRDAGCDYWLPKFLGPQAVAELRAEFDAAK